MKYTFLFTYIFFSINLFAQKAPNLTDLERKTTIDTVCYLLQKYYVSPEKALKISEALKTNLQNGIYDKLLNPYIFADEINKNMLTISKDNHLVLNYIRNNSKENLKLPTSAYLQNYELELKQKNYGFKELKILEGNIGYMRIDDFVSPKYSGETAVTALNFLSNSHAIVFDMRYNTGGDVGLIQLIMSQFYSADTTIHLNNFYYKATNSTTQMWTVPNIKGNKMPKMPIYVLTSNKTFSSAEAFAYNLQALKRGIVIGEKTGGGANAGNIEPISNIFTLFLPNEITTNPITKSNWETTGVIPDIVVASQNALEKAQLVALENLVNTANTNKLKLFHKWNYEIVKAKTNAITIPLEKLKLYIGIYGVRTLSIENNKLFYQRAGKPKRELIALDNISFTPLETSDFCIKIVIENGKSTAILISFQNGEEEKHEKND